MPTVLVTGGTGVLGREVVPRLAAAGHTVRIMSRGARPAGADPALEWAQAELETGRGLERAVAGAEVIVHCASSPRRRTWQADVEGTRRLLAAAAGAATGHFFYISIVGVDRIPLGYYKAKLATEKIIEETGVPWSVLRATQFHTLIDMFLSVLIRPPAGLLPGDLQFQPIDAGEVAERMVQHLAGGPAGRLPDIGGPQVRSFGDLARAWLKARRKRALVLPLPLPGRAAAAFRHGYNCTQEHAEGRITWEEWLSQRYVAK